MQANEYQKMFEFENEYWWYRGLHELVYHYVKSASAGKETVLFDAGCGTGRTLEFIRELGQTSGVDYSPQAIDLCRSRGLHEVEVADLNHWQAKPESKDVLISLDVICTDGVVDDTKVLKAFQHALRPGGYLILNLPAFDALRRRHDEAVSGLRRYKKRSTMKVLKELGFRVERAGYRLPVLFLFILFMKPFERNQTGPAESDLRPLPGWLNRVLLFWNRLDNVLFRFRLSLPFGSSLFIVCRK